MINGIGWFRLNLVTYPDNAYFIDAQIHNHDGFDFATEGDMIGILDKEEIERRQKDNVSFFDAKMRNCTEIRLDYDEGNIISRIDKEEPTEQSLKKEDKAGTIVIRKTEVVI